MVPGDPRAANAATTAVLARALVLALSGAMVGGCVSPGPGGAVSDARENTLTTLFLPGKSLLDGFARPDARPGWRVGDEMLFGLLLEDRDQRQVRFVKLTLKTVPLPAGREVVVCAADDPRLDSPDSGDVLLVTHPYASTDGQHSFKAAIHLSAYTLRYKSGRQQAFKYRSHQVLMAVDLFDERAQHIETSFVLVPETALQHGLYPFAREHLQLRNRYGERYHRVLVEQAETGGHGRGYARLLNTIAALQQTLWACDNLVPTLMQMTPEPSIWSVMVNLGVRFKLNLASGALGEAHLPFAERVPGRRVLRLPLVLEINDIPYLRCDLLVTGSKPPVQLSAGVVGADVTLSHKRWRQLHVRLLAARRGD